jgi:hypothetical protein
VLFGATTVSAQSFEAVPSGDVIGLTLTAADANFSIEAPSDDWHWSVATVEDARSDDRVVGFVGARGGLYAITAVIGDDDDERLFGRFAGSFRLLRPVPTLPRLTVAFLLIDCVLLALAWWGASGFIAPAIMPRLVGPLAAILVLLTLLALGLGARNVAVGSRGPDELDHTLGRIAGVCLVLAGAGFITRRGRRQDAPS